MEHKTYKWVSNHLSEEVMLKVYGHFGFVMLLFPSNYPDAENLGLINSVSAELEKGKCKIVSLENIDSHFWLDADISNEEKSQRHRQFNNFIAEEVIPFIYGECGGVVPILTAGASFGAFHAVNTYFRRPDIIYGCIGMSGAYDLKAYTNGYFDDNCYFNSPIHYLPNLNDGYWISFLMNKHHVYLISGTGENENSQFTEHLCHILNMKSIPHQKEIHGEDYGHNIKSWEKIFANIIRNKL